MGNSNVGVLLPRGLEMCFEMHVRDFGLAETMSGRGSVCKSTLNMGCVSHVVIQGGNVKVGEGKGRVQFLKEKCRKSVGSGYCNGKNGPIFAGGP